MPGSDCDVNPVLVNMGCGATWHPDWINLDVRPVSPQVRRWDVQQGLPFEDGQVDACYASHVLEHLTREQADMLLRESLRVLRPGGIVRIAVPDLEAIAREYLNVLAQAEKGDPEAAGRYEWIMLELLDQLVRTESGGDMERYLRNGANHNAEYIVSRVGPESEEVMTQGRNTFGRSTDGQGPSLKRRLKQALASVVSPFVRESHCSVLEIDRMDLGFSRIVLGRRKRQALREGLFRMSGECHRWMYDRFSLGRVLHQSGFEKVEPCTAFESRIAGFSSFNLDVSNGRIRKPDSLFMEAVKPGRSIA